MLRELSGSLKPIFQRAGVAFAVLGGVLTTVVLVALLSLAGSHGLDGYIRELPPETTEQRQQRLSVVEARRSQDVIVICHRGATPFAPENTLEACSAAIDYGADGVEVDVRLSADGVLYLFHDDMLERLTDGFGKPSWYTYSEILNMKPRLIYGLADKHTRPPTFAAFLELARRKGILIHLDIKELSAESEIIKMLDSGDMWDHLVSVSPYNSAEILKHPKARPLTYKGPGLYETRLDWDEDSIRKQLASDGRMIMVEDPRLIVSVLGRTPKPPDLMPNLRERWVLTSASTGFPSDFIKRRLPQIMAMTSAELVRLVSDNPEEAGKVDGDETYQNKRLESILSKAMAAAELGRRPSVSRDTVSALERLVSGRSLHRDWLYHGLDGAMAVRALAEAGSRKSVPFLIDRFKQQSDDLELVANARYEVKNYEPLEWRIKREIMEAVGTLRTKEAKQFLLKYLESDEETVRQWAPPMYEAAARSLLKHKLSERDILKLLNHSRPEVRGVAIEFCAQSGSRAARSALQKAQPAIYGLLFAEGGRIP